jgi:hypothetical protein
MTASPNSTKKWIRWSSGGGAVPGDSPLWGRRPAAGDPTAVRPARGHGQRYQSGEVDRAGRVSKCGDGMVRGLLFEAAKILLRRSTRPTALLEAASRRRPIAMP